MLKDIVKDLELHRMRPSARDDLHFMNIPEKAKSWAITFFALSAGIAVYFYFSYKIEENPFNKKLVSQGVAPGMTILYSDHAGDKKLLVDKKIALESQLKNLENEFSAGEGYYNKEMFAEDYINGKLSTSKTDKINKIVDNSPVLAVLRLYDLMHRIYSDADNTIQLNGTDYKLLDVLNKLKTSRYKNDYSARLEAPVNALMLKYNVTDKLLMTRAVKTMVQHNKSTKNLISGLAPYQTLKKELVDSILRENWNMKLHDARYKNKEKELEAIQLESKIIIKQFRAGNISRKDLDAEFEILKKEKKDLNTKKYKNVSSGYLNLNVGEGNIFDKISQIRTKIGGKKKHDYLAKKEILQKKRKALKKELSVINQGLDVIGSLPYDLKKFNDREEKLEKIIMKVEE